MKIFALSLVLLFATAVFPQTANVIELTPADQARAQKAYDALQKAQTEWESLRTNISDKYVTGQTITPHGYGVPEWANGFEFSKDFRFIVPKQSEQNNSYGNIVLTPQTPHCSGNVCW